MPRFSPGKSARGEGERWDRTRDLRLSAETSFSRDRLPLSGRRPGKEKRTDSIS